MTEAKHMASKALAQNAADWVARLGGAPAEADWLAFEAWLNAGDGHRAAYDKALALSLAIDAQAPALARQVDRARQPAWSRASRPVLWGSGLMASAAIAVAVVALHPTPQPKATLYATAKGERRDVVLPDGTRVALNADTRLSVAIQRDRRELTLASGEAAFQVVHDANRPFVVHVGDRILRDVGTEFDVSRQAGLIRVTVREGMVAVTRPGAEERSLSMGPGSRMEHKEGSSDTVVLASDPNEAFSWQTGRLIYRDRPLSEVAADLNRYGRETVRVSGRASGLRFTGVLTVDDQSAMVHRLTGLLPLAASRKDGVILLSELNSSQ
jgi:transmembrane sensor